MQVYREEKKENRKAVADGSVKLANLPRNWLHQGFRYMDSTEKLGRAIIELAEIILLLLILAGISDRSFLNVLSIAIAAVLVHTINWIVNSNWWALMLFAFPGLNNPGESVTCSYLNRMAQRLKRSSCISGVLIFGSVARKAWHNRSDIDIRLLRKPGFPNNVFAFFIMTRERFLAFCSAQPIDMFLADDSAFLEKMREDETPIFLLKRDKHLEQAYPEQQETILCSLH